MVRQLRHQGRGHSRRAQQQGLQPDDHVEPQAHRLAGQQCADDEAAGPCRAPSRTQTRGGRWPAEEAHQCQGIRQDGDRPSDAACPRLSARAAKAVRRR